MWIKATSVYNAKKIYINMDYLTSACVDFTNKNEFFIKAYEAGQDDVLYKLGIFNTREKAEKELDKIMDYLREDEHFCEVNDNYEVVDNICDNPGLLEVEE